MVYNRFRLNCIIRVILLSGTIYSLFYLYLNTAYYATMLICAIITIYQIYGLIHYVEKTDRELTRFLLSIRYEDFTESFTSKGKSYADQLRAAFSEVMSEFRRIRAEREEHFRYLQTVVQHVGIGLIVYKTNGDVELVNSAAKKIFGINQLKNIQDFESYGSNLVEVLRNLRSGSKRIIKLSHRNELLQLAIYATEFRMQSQLFTLVSIQNINTELEEKEMEAWQNLIRVLTHEIRNSITPISSLAGTAENLLQDSDEKNGNREEGLEDVYMAIQTIRKRSQGLHHFVDSFKNLSQVPKPKFKIISIKDLFFHIESFFKEQFKENEIHYSFSVDPETLELTADPKLIEQVLINLVFNAIHAVKGQPNPQINVTANIDERGRALIQVVDNGLGILEEVLDKIFIPFFTTKQDGSGIGLSLSRQIMRLHHGSIGAQSKPNESTVFTMRF